MGNPPLMVCLLDRPIRPPEFPCRWNRETSGPEGENERFHLLIGASRRGPHMVHQEAAPAGPYALRGVCPIDMAVAGGLSALEGQTLAGSPPRRPPLCSSPWSSCT